MHDVVVANGRTFGGGMIICPGRRAGRRPLRRAHDRRPDEARPAGDAAEDLPRQPPAAREGGAAARRGRRQSTPTRRCRSSSTASSRARRPARFEVEPGALRVRVPASAPRVCYSAAGLRSRHRLSPSSTLRRTASSACAADCSSLRDALRRARPARSSFFCISSQPRLACRSPVSATSFEPARHVPRASVQRLGCRDPEPCARGGPSAVSSPCARSYPPAPAGNRGATVRTAFFAPASTSEPVAGTGAGAAAEAATADRHRSLSTAAPARKRARKRPVSPVAGSRSRADRIFTLSRTCSDTSTNATREGRDGQEHIGRRRTPGPPAQGRDRTYALRQHAPGSR